jgi:hypothetical protein
MRIFFKEATLDEYNQVAKNATLLFFFVIFVPSVKERAELKDYGQHLGKGRAN